MARVFAEDHNVVRLPKFRVTKGHHERDNMISVPVSEHEMMLVPAGSTDPFIPEKYMLPHPLGIGAKKIMGATDG